MYGQMNPLHQQSILEMVYPINVREASLGRGSQRSLVSHTHTHTHTHISFSLSLAMRSLSLLLLCAVLMITFLAAYVIREQRITIVHESSVGIVLGLIIGAVVSNASTPDQLADVITFQ